MIVDQIIKKLGNLEQVYLTGDLAEGKNSPFVDLVIVGNVDKVYMHQLIEKVEPLIQKKVRVASFSKEEFNNNMLTDIGATLSLFKI